RSAGRYRAETYYDDRVAFRQKRRRRWKTHEIAAFPQARLAGLKPFIDTALFEKVSPAPDPRRLMTVAMMRAGDKMDRYVML
ncbi:hypothetical protein ACC678_37400, partial [Rhizobium ruizarguesonis]